MTRNQAIEDQTEEDIGAAVVMTPQANEDSVLWISLAKLEVENRDRFNTFWKFSTTSRKFITTAE